MYKFKIIKHIYKKFDTIYMVMFKLNPKLYLYLPPIFWLLSRPYGVFCYGNRCGGFHDWSPGHTQTYRYCKSSSSLSINCSDQVNTAINAPSCPDFDSQVGQIAPKWDKSGTFSDEISVHFGSPSQNVLKSHLKKSRICPNWDKSAPPRAEIGDGDECTELVIVHPQRAPPYNLHGLIYVWASWSCAVWGPGIYVFLITFIPESIISQQYGTQVMNTTKRETSQ